jgi:hypothetical protein
MDSLKALRNLACLLFCVTACSDRGEEGGHCKSEGIFGPSYCNAGLLCNTVNYVCQRPSSLPKGAACSQNALCVKGLWCQKGICSEFLQAGEPCLSGVGCADGLYCHKSDAGILCTPGDGG